MSGSLAKAASGDDRNAPAVALPSKARREIGPASRASADVVRRMQTRSLYSMAAAARTQSNGDQQMVADGGAPRVRVSCLR